MNSNLRKSISGNSVLQRRKSYDLGCRRSSINENPSRNSGRQSNPKPRSSSEERKSGVNFGFHGRRSSIFNENKGQMKDVRPLKEKAYQKKKVAEIVEFLQAEGCPHQITENKLMQPSKRDFELIFQFLVCYFNESYTVKRLEDEAPKILSELSYPFVPNKSAFQYVAKTNYPSLLGVLIFLVDTYKFIKDFDFSLFLKTGTEEQMVLLGFIIHCYYKDIDESQIRESMVEIIKEYKLVHDYDELNEKKFLLKTRLQEVLTKQEEYDHLKMVAEQQQGNIKKYQEFFASIKDRKRKKDEICEKLADQLALKEKELKELNELCAEKERLYDAQGFDGKKQISFYEDQKKELAAKLQAKQELRKAIQNKTWDAEMLYAQTLEKGSSTCEAFNELYPKVQELADRNLEVLRGVRDPQARTLGANLPTQFPELWLRQGAVSGSRAAFMGRLEEIRQKVDVNNACLKTIEAKIAEEKTSFEMEIKKMSLSIKVATAQKTKVERELLAKEKEAKEKWHEFEALYDKDLKKIEKCQIEKMEAEEKIKKLSEELSAIEKIVNEKQKMLDDYLQSQKDLFTILNEKLERRKKMIEESGESIHQAIKKTIK